jgi:GT2 family glycosyltransferase
MNRHEISVIIPTFKGDPLTLESVPDDIETIIVSEGNRSEARNIGVERSNGNILVFCDDDIAFSENFFYKQVCETPLGTLTGLVDFDFDLLLTRFMVINRADFDCLGGFDKHMNHMEDTEFSLQALKAGMGLRYLPQDAVFHKDHEKSGNNFWTRLTYSLYLFGKYPRRWFPLFITMLWQRGK